MYTIKKKYHFYSAHRNQELPGKCENLHGHVYRVKVSFRVDDVNSNGATLVFGDIDKTIEPIIKKLDHATLVAEGDELLINSTIAFPKIFGKIYVLPYEVTSVELLAKHLYKLIRVTPIGTHLSSVSIKETESSEVIYS